MKIFDIFRSLTSKLGSILNGIVTPGMLGHKKLIKTAAESIKKGRKASRKRRTFSSFLKSHDSSVRSASSRIKRKVTRASGQGHSNRQFKKLIKNDEDSWQSAYNLEDKITNQMLPSGKTVTAEPLFMDKDGLEISAIEVRDSRSDILASEGESDQEILKFVFGEDELQKRTEEGQPKIHNEVVYIRKEWWQQALEKSINANDSLPLAAVSGLQDSHSVSHVSGVEAKNRPKVKKQKTKQIRHTGRPKGASKSGIRVLNIVDLVANEDNPKLFQIPLAEMEAK